MQFRKAEKRPIRARISAVQLNGFGILACAAAVSCAQTSDETSALRGVDTSAAEEGDASATSKNAPADADVRGSDGKRPAGQGADGDREAGVHPSDPTTLGPDGSAPGTDVDPDATVQPPPTGNQADAAAEDAGQAMPVSQNCNPALPAPPGCDGLREFAWGGHCYQLELSNGYIFDTAEIQCSAWGGHLWTLNCQEEVDYVMAQLPPVELPRHFWEVRTGGNRIKDGVTWEWLSGQEWNQDLLPWEEFEALGEDRYGTLPGVDTLTVLLSPREEAPVYSSARRSTLPFVCER